MLDYVLNKMYKFLNKCVLKYPQQIGAFMHWNIGDKFANKLSISPLIKIIWNKLNKFLYKVLYLTGES